MSITFRVLRFPITIGLAFPAFLLIPLVALVGPDTASSWQPIVNSALAVFGLALLWRFAVRVGSPLPFSAATLAFLGLRLRRRRLR